METEAHPIAHHLASLSWGEYGVYAGLAPEDIVVERIDHFGWRVRDGRFPRGERPSIIGLIELTGERFGVLRLGYFEKETFSSLDEAVEHLTTAVIGAEPAA